MEVSAVFEKVSRGFAPHTLELDDWGGVKHIKFNGQHIGIICETVAPKTPLPKILVETQKMHRAAYAKGVGKQIFTLIQHYIQWMHEEEKRLAEIEKMKSKQEFQTSCIEHIENLYNDGQIDYDRIKRSKSTESVYIYKGKKRILRISTHSSPLKNCNYENSIIIKPEEVETKLDETIPQLIPQTAGDETVKKEACS